MSILYLFTILIEIFDELHVHNAFHSISFVTDYLLVFYSVSYGLNEQLHIVIAVFLVLLQFRGFVFEIKQ
jgi:hypothetical protein